MVGLAYFKDPKDFIEDSNDMKDVYNSIEEYKQSKKRKVLIVLVDMIADIINNKKLHPVVTEVFIWTRKWNIFLLFIT